jgi:hypothetical protein
VEPADRHRDPSSAKLRGHIDGARKLVRLHTDQANEAAIRRLDPPRDFLDRDDRMALVIGADLERHIRPERPPRRDVLRQGIEAGERIGRDPGPPPLDHIAVVVVMRRLDQLDDKAALPHPRLAP